MDNLSIQDMLLFQAVHLEANRLMAVQSLPGQQAMTWDQALVAAHASVTRDLARFADLQRTPVRSP